MANEKVEEIEGIGPAKRGKLREVNAEKRLTRRTSNDAEVRDWVEQAKPLPPKIEY